MILEQIGISTIDFGVDILLYAIENFDPAIQKIFDNLFKEADIEEGQGGKMDEAMFGEILGDGMIIEESQLVSEAIINEIVDRDSEEV